MVARVRVEMDIAALSRALNASVKNIRYAAAVSLTHMAKSSQTRLTKKIEQQFDRATPWIRKSVFIAPATKVTLTAEVGIKDQGTRATPAHYLNQHLNAGARGGKPMELALRNLGILPDGYLVVPSRTGVKLDAYGNVNKTTLRKIIQAIATGATAAAGGGRFRMFVVKPGTPMAGRLHPGVWSSASVSGQSQLMPVLLFVPGASYQQVIDLESMVGAIVAAEFPQKFRAVLDQALAQS